MYNEELKNRYIEYKEAITTTTPYFLKTIFTNAEPFENLYGTDLFNFSTLEIINMYKTFNYTNIASLNVVNSAFALYTDWCINQGQVNDYQNHYRELTKEVLANCLNVLRQKRSIVTKEEVYGVWANQLLNTQDVVLILGLFEGIKGKDFNQFVNLKLQDIHDDDTIDLFEVGNRKFSTTLCEACRSAAHAEYYYPYNATSERKFKFLPSDNVIKDYQNASDDVSDFYKGRRIYSKIRRIFKELGVEGYMTANSLQMSGILYNIQSKAKEQKVPFDYVINSEDYNGIMEIYQKNIPRTSILLQYAEAFTTQ